MKPENVARRVYRAIEKKANKKPRNYLGASSVGHALTCKRRTWLSWRKVCVESFDGRTLRLFRTGHLQEDRIILELIDAGYRFVGAASGMGTQTQIRVEAFQGLFSGHADGLIATPNGPWMLFECKTASKSSFAQHVGGKRSEPKPVQDVKPVHYAQIQVYMGLLRAGQMPEGVEGDAPSQALYLVINKDNEQIHCEIVDFDQDYFDMLGGVIREVLTATEPPPKPFRRPDYKACMYCPAQAFCWEGQDGQEVCGTCTYFSVDIETGEKRCNLHARDTVQSETCDDYTPAGWVEQESKVTMW